MPRMEVLNRSEREFFDSPPAFTSRDRRKFLSFPSGLLDVARKFSNPRRGVFFLLSAGYFRARRRFYSQGDYMDRDISYVSGLLDVPCSKDDFLSLSETSIRRDRSTILSYYGFSPFNGRSSSMLQEQALNMLKRYIRPKQVFWSCVDLLVSKRIALPTSFRISDIIISSISKREKQLLDIIDTNLDKATKGMLDSFFIFEDDKRYKISLIKRVSHSISPSKIRDRSSDLLYFRDLYKKIEPILSLLDLGQEGMRYYANSIIEVSSDT